MIDLKEIFDRFDDEFLKFERVEEKLHSRPDVCAFLLLDKLVSRPGRDMVTVAEHDEIYLDTDCEQLARVATEADIRTLRRCGVLYNEDIESLMMFV